MRVIQTIASTRIEYGGTSRSVPQLCDALLRHGVDTHLVTTKPTDSSIPCNFPEDVTRFHTTPERTIIRQWGLAKGFEKVLLRLAVPQNQTVIHDHAVWLPTNHAVATFARRHAIPRVVSPRGMLGEWALANGKWKKRIAWWLYQHRDLLTATAFHATSEMEAKEIRRLGFQQPIIVAANGLELPENLPTPRGLDSKQFLFLSRLHRKKGLLELLDAWHESSATARGWKLKIAGPDEGGFRSTIERRVDELKLTQSVTLCGEISGRAKWELIADSAYFILPSFNENFGIAIAESLACGVPVITTKNTPWQSIDTDRAGWWIEHEHTELVNAMNEAINLPSDTWKEFSTAAASIGRSFRWSDVSKSLTRFYSQLTS